MVRFSVKNGVRRLEGLHQEVLPLAKCVGVFLTPTGTGNIRVSWWENSQREMDLMEMDGEEPSRYGVAISFPKNIGG